VRRTLFVLSVTALMAAMIVGSALPAFALSEQRDPPIFQCISNDEVPTFVYVPGNQVGDYTVQGYSCRPPSRAVLPV
jgi:hypothetical protein